MLKAPELEIVVRETPDGDFVAVCGSLKAEGSTAEEAEELLREQLRMQWEANPIGSRPAIVGDEDEVPAGSEER